MFCIVRIHEVDFLKFWHLVSISVRTTSRRIDFQRLILFFKKGRNSYMAKLFLIIAEILFLCIAAASSDSADIFFLESFDTAGELFKFPSLYRNCNTIYYSTPIWLFQMYLVLASGFKVQWTNMSDNLSILLLDKLQLLASRTTLEYNSLRK